MKEKEVKVMMAKREAGILVDIWMLLDLPFDMAISSADASGNVLVKISLA